MLKVNKIEKNYKNFHLDCTMEVPAGCITGLIGENGAGKSTTFKAIENLIFLDGGSVELFGKPHDQLTAGMDVVARDEVLTLLREYMEEDESRAILISSHISGDLEGLCDDIYMIHEGRIVLHEDTDRLLSSYGLLKMTEERFRTVDRSHLLKKKKESYGYSCLTDEIRYYMENYPDITAEKGSIDEIIMMTVKGEAV